MSEFIYHKPKYKLVRIINGLKEIIVSGDIALMCPKCFHVIESNVSSSKTIDNIGNTVAESICINDKYFGKCTNCNDDVDFIQIDANMAQIINILNTKGYYTAFSCEGHIESDDYSGKKEFTNPYIYFYFWDYTENLIDNPLPESWHIDPLDKRCKIFNINDNILDSAPKYIDDHDELINWLENNWDQKKRLEDIYNWAVNLPDIPESKKKKYYKIIERDGDNILFKNSNKIIKASK